MKSKAKCLVLILFLLNSITDLFAASNNAVVLMYHRFDENKYPSTNVRKEQFIEQLDFLQNNNFKIWPLPKIIEYLKNRQQLPDKVVAISVDDAYASVYQVAFPLLKKRNLPFTLFVATNHVDHQYSNYMNWEQVKEMAESGVTIGNHSKSHDHLIDKLPGESESAWLSRVMNDVKSAEMRIKEKTGVETTLFAYPYGEFNLALSEALKKNAYVAFGQQSGPFDENSDFGFLPRFPVSENYADLNELSTKIKSVVMPVESVYPLEVVTESNRPEMIIKLFSAPQNKDDLQCYVSGQQKPLLKWLSVLEFSVTASESISTRRARFNCTLRDNNSGRYYWYSHLWIRPDIAEE